MRGIFADAQQRSGLGAGFILAKTQYQHGPVAFGQARHARFKMGRELFPVGGSIGLVQGGLHVDLLFALMTADVGTELSRGDEPRGLIKPARKYAAFRHAAGFAGQGDEDSLGHVLRIAFIAGAAMGNRIDKINISLHQFGKGCLGVVPGVFSVKSMSDMSGI